MPTMRMNVTVQQKGTIFNAAATKAAAARFIIAANELLAVEAVSRVKDRLQQVLRNPTGYYESRIVVDRRAITAVSVTLVWCTVGGWKGYPVATRLRASRDTERLLPSAAVCSRTKKS